MLYLLCWYHAGSDELWEARLITCGSHLPEALPGFTTLAYSFSSSLSIIHSDCHYSKLPKTHSLHCCVVFKVVKAGVKKDGS